MFIRKNNKDVVLKKIEEILLNIYNYNFFYEVVKTFEKEHYKKDIETKEEYINNFIKELIDLKEEITKEEEKIICTNINVNNYQGYLEERAFNRMTKYSNNFITNIVALNLLKLYK